MVTGIMVLLVFIPLITAAVVVEVAQMLMLVRLLLVQAASVAQESYFQISLLGELQQVMLHLLALMVDILPEAEEAAARLRED